MKKINSIAKSVILKTCLIVSVAAVLASCGKSAQPLDQLVFGDNPIVQIKDEIESFKNFPKEDLEVLMAYLTVNEKARMEGKNYSVIQGKPVLLVMREANVWKGQIELFMKQANEIAQSIARQVTVTPITKGLTVSDNAIGKSSIMKITYQVSNKTDREITGLGGRIKYMWPDGKEIATIAIVFDKSIAPGAGIAEFGHQPILVGSRASKEMKDFSEIDLNRLKWEFIPTAIRYGNNEIVQVPSL